MKSSIALEQKIKIVSSDLIADNALIQVIKDNEIEKVRVLWVEQRDKENVICDYEFGPFKVIAQNYDVENETVILYSNDNQIIEYNDKALARYRGPRCGYVNYVDLVEVFNFSNHHSIAPYDNCEKTYKKLFKKEPILEKYKRK